VKKVEEDGSRVRDSERNSVNSRLVPAQRYRPMSDLCFSKVGFLEFIAMVINCPSEMECKSRKIDAAVKAAEKCIGVRDLTSVESQGMLSCSVPSSQVIGLG
jgi:hypothetical protein